MIEVNWGRPLSLIVSPQGDIQTFSTIEQARYWLRRKWPVADAAQRRALVQTEAAMHCLVPLGAARLPVRSPHRRLPACRSGPRLIPIGQT